MGSLPPHAASWWCTKKGPRRVFSGLEVRARHAIVVWPFVLKYCCARQFRGGFDCPVAGCFVSAPLFYPVRNG